MKNKTKEIKFTYRDEMVDDLKSIHNIDIIKEIKHSLHKLSRTWITDDNKMRFTLKTTFIPYNGGDDELTINLEKENL
jgi:hypothetical protein